MNDKTAVDNQEGFIAESPINKVKRLNPEEIDERYIRAFLNHPEQSKTTALAVAGHPNPTSQRAYQIHERLLDKIDQGLDKLILQDAALGRRVLVNLALHSSSDAVRGSSASKLMEYAGKQKPDRIVVESRAPEDIDAEIAILQRRILIAQGEDVPEDEPSCNYE